MAGYPDKGHAVPPRAPHRGRAATALIVALALAGSACSTGQEPLSAEARPGTGSGSEPAPATVADATPSATATSARPPRTEPPPEPQPTTTAARETSSADGDRTRSPRGVEVVAPRPGRYVYELSQSDSDDTFTDRVRRHRTAAGLRITVDSRSSRSDATATTVLRWRPSRVLLDAHHVRLGSGQEFRCVIGGDVELLRFPLKPERYPVRQWRNDRCSGAARTTVHEFVDITLFDRSWTVARTVTRMTITTTSTDGEHTFENTYTETSWFSPELGKELQRDRSGVSKLDGYESRGRFVPVLRDYPG